MTMSFKVADKSLLDKLAPGKQVEFPFSQMQELQVLTSESAQMRKVV